MREAGRVTGCTIAARTTSKAQRHHVCPTTNCSLPERYYLAPSVPRLDPPQAGTMGNLGGVVKSLCPPPSLPVPLRHHPGSILSLHLQRPTRSDSGSSSGLSGSHRS
eukprot:1260883-Prymnesium_polylepis.1